MPSEVGYVWDQFKRDTAWMCSQRSVASRRSGETAEQRIDSRYEIFEPSSNKPSQTTEHDEYL